VRRSEINSALTSQTLVVVLEIKATKTWF